MFLVYRFQCKYNIKMGSYLNSVEVIALAFDKWYDVHPYQQSETVVSGSRLRVLRWAFLF